MNELLNVCNEKNIKKRDTNIELLRIIAMVSIIAHHFSVHGGFNLNGSITINTIWLQFLASGAKIGVNIYILISGYYLINSKKISIEKVLKLVFQMMFYSIGIYVIEIAMGYKKFNIVDFNNSLLGYQMWWFALTYLELYLIHPYINKYLNILDKKSYQRILLFLTFLFSIIPTFTKIPFDSGFLIWFIYIYSIGGYLKKYPIKLKWSAKKYFLWSLNIYMLSVLGVVTLHYITGIITSVAIATVYSFGIENIGTVLMSIIVFIAFSKLNIKYNKTINLIASTTFGIYLIHDHIWTRMYLWRFLFKNYIYSNTMLLIPYSLCIIVYVFTVCSIIELIRIYVLEKRCIKLIKNISDVLENKISELFKLNIFDKI